MSPLKTAPDTFESPTEQRVVGDVACRHCGYNLRTLLVTGRCPECGNAVADSLRIKTTPHGPPLETSDPAWLRTLGFGCLTLCAAVVLPTLGYIWTDHHLASLGGYGRYRQPSLGQALEGAMGASGVVLSMYAIYLLALREPRRQPAAPHGLQRFLRTSPLAYALAIVGMAAGGWFSFYVFEPPQFFRVLAGLVLGIPSLAPIFVTPLIYIHMHRLLSRSRDSHRLRVESIALGAWATLVEIVPALLPNLGSEEPPWWRIQAGIGDPFLCFAPPIDNLGQVVGAIVTLWALTFWSRSAVLFLRLSRCAAR